MDKLFFTEEHEMLKNMVRDFAENEVEPLAREMDEKETIPKDLNKLRALLKIFEILPKFCKSSF